MSLYADYITEKTKDHILETYEGFLTYRFIPEQKSVYLIDLYVRFEFRKSGVASRMADSVAMDAKELGYNKMLGSVVPSSRNSTESVKVLFAYGMRLKSSSNDFILFEKDI